MKSVNVEKNMEEELPIPSLWKQPLSEMANAFIERKFPNPKISHYLNDWDKRILSINYGNINDYPDELGVLHPDTWETSMYLWEGNYWIVLLDLSDRNGHTTDLVFHFKVREERGGYKFEPGLIYVP